MLLGLIPEPVLSTATPVGNLDEAAVLSILLESLSKSRHMILPLGWSVTFPYPIPVLEPGPYGEEPDWDWDRCGEGESMRVGSPTRVLL